MTQTPLQEAIQYWKERANEAPNIQLRKAAQLFVQYLESLLPKEKGFAGKVWEAAESCAADGENPDKFEFLNQLYPEK